MIWVLHIDTGYITPHTRQEQSCYFFNCVWWYLGDHGHCRRNLVCLINSTFKGKTLQKLFDSSYSLEVINGKNNWNKFYCKTSFSLQIVSSLTDSSGLLFFGKIIPGNLKNHNSDQQYKKSIDDQIWLMIKVEW